MIPYDTDRIKQIMDESQSSNSTYDKGKNSRIWHATFLRSCLELQLRKEMQ